MTHSTGIHRAGQRHLCTTIRTALKSMTTCLAVFRIPGAWRIKLRTLRKHDSCTCTLCIGTPQSHTFIIHVCGKCTRTIIFSYLVRYDFESSRIVYLRLIQFTCISTGRPCAQLSSRSIPEWTNKQRSIQSHSTSTKNHNYLELSQKQTSNKKTKPGYAFLASSV